MIWIRQCGRLSAIPMWKGLNFFGIFHWFSYFFLPFFISFCVTNVFLYSAQLLLENVVWCRQNAYWRNQWVTLEMLLAWFIQAYMAEGLCYIVVKPSFNCVTEVEFYAVHYFRHSISMRSEKALCPQNFHTKQFWINQTNVFPEGHATLAGVIGKVGGSVSVRSLFCRLKDGQNWKHWLGEC